MARNDCYSAESFYFCGVKNQLRHEVAGSASVFRADNFIGKIVYPDECGSSNARKGSAVDTLTARIGILYCQKFNCMAKTNEMTDAQVKCITGIQEYLEDFHSVADLYQRLANALTELMLVEIHMPNEARKKVNDMAQDYLALLDLLDPINPLTHPIEKGGEV